MAPLVRIASDFGALAAAHVSLQLMDRRCLRSPHDVEGNCLMRVAAKAFHFEIGRTRRGSHRRARAMAAPAPESRASACSKPRRRAGRHPCALPSPAPQLLGSMRRRWSRVTWCPFERGCAGPRGTGKPLQIAVDDVTGTTVAARTLPWGIGAAPSALSLATYVVLQSRCSASADALTGSDANAEVAAQPASTRVRASALRLSELGSSSVRPFLQS
jgi:hypothetical protein